MQSFRRLIDSRMIFPVIMLFSALMVLVPVVPFLGPVAVAGQVQEDDDDIAEACEDANAKAERDISGGTWFAIGCLVGVIGYLIALIETNPPAMELLGKSEQYVASYTDCYKKKAKDIKTKNALTGCLVATAANVILYAILIANADSD